MVLEVPGLQALPVLCWASLLPAGQQTSVVGGGLKTSVSSCFWSPSLAHNCQETQGALRPS